MINKIAKAKLALLALLAVGALQSCEKDILTGQPEWLGNSIYERLQEGIDGKSFNYTIRLINDLDQTEVLSQTGSKTLFVASDEEYDKWFSSNTWGVRSYDELTKSQKKELFNGTMINNAYLIELMSNIEATTVNGDPEQGACMRRETAASIYDNVPVMNPSEFPSNPDLPGDPVNKAWKEVKDANKAIYIMQDDSPTPMIHFLPAYMQKNNIKDTDLKIISNGESDNINDSWISGKKVISSEQTCKNGYIYVVNGVMETNPNMAAIIRDENKDVSTTKWASFLSRFSAPEKVVMSENEKLVFDRQHPELADKDLYVLRYLNTSTNHQYTSPTGKTADNLSTTLLKLDPGWNQYTAAEVSMKNDAGVMLVPSDDAVNSWLTSGVGKTLVDRYGSFEKIDLETVAKLINVNTFGSFAATVPSKFESVQNDAQMPLNIVEGNIVKCFMGCNGVVYVVNKVFEPAEFSSVTFPALMYGGDPDPTKPDELSFQVIYKAMQGRVSGSPNSDYDLDFTPYLTAMDSKFNVIIPYNMILSKGNTNDVKNRKVVRFIDPCSWGMVDDRGNSWIYECYVDTAGYHGPKGAVVAKAYKADVANDGTVTMSSAGSVNVSSTIVANRLFDYLDNAIVLGEISGSQEFYKTKAGSTVGVKGNKVRGGLQMERGYDITVDNIYPESNGNTYGIVADASIDNTVVKSRVPQTASKSLYKLLKEEADKSGGDKLFYDMIYKPSKDAQTQYILSSSTNSKFVCLMNDFNYKNFDNYNYTVYVPKDEEVQKWIDAGYLPTWEDFDKISMDNYPSLTDKEIKAAQDTAASIITNFVKYHIQDNSVYVGGAPCNNTQYETGTLNMANKRFYTVSVTTDATSGSVKGSGNDSPIPFATEYYNKPGREMWIELPSGYDALTANNVYNSKIAASSYIVVHKINGVLCYDKTIQQKNWWERAKLPNKP